MAGGADPPECASMGIVTAMATVAVHGKRRDRDMQLGMTIVARDTRMTPGQREFRLFAVIELPEHPAVGVVATITGCSEAAFVMRVLVAIRAGARRILERLILMTSLARDCSVQSD